MTVSAQRARDRLERSADIISGCVSERLAAGERLTMWAAEPSNPDSPPRWS